MDITGKAAILIAETSGLCLNKYCDPLEEAREGLTVEEAVEVAREDQSLIWLEGLQVEEVDGEWTIVDDSGCRWWPTEEGLTRDEVVQLLAEDPSAGEWRS